MRAKVAIKQGGSGVIDWGNGHSQSFEYPARSARDALGLGTLDDVEPQIIPLSDEEAAFYFVQGPALQYDWDANK
jgi:hypothetical protein